MWLLFALGALVVCAVCSAIAGYAANNHYGIIAFIFGLGAFVSGMAGLGVCRK